MHGAERLLHRDILIPARALEDVELLAPVELLDDVADGPVDLGRRAVGLPAVRSGRALDTEDNLVRVLWVLLEVALQEDKAVVLLWAIKLSAIEEVAAVIESGLDCLKGLLLGTGIRTPRQT